MLNVNYEELDTISSTIMSQGNEFSDLLVEIKNQNAKLQEAWAGSDASAYTSKVAMQAVEMDKLVSTIQEIGVFLQNVSNTYRDTQNRITNAINN